MSLSECSTLGILKNEYPHQKCRADHRVQYGTSPVMTKAALYRLICLLLACTAYAANGAAWSEGETIAIPYCTVHGTGVLELSIGTEAPEPTNTCCGDGTSPIARRCAGDLQGRVWTGFGPAPPQA